MNLDDLLTRNEELKSQLDEANRSVLTIQGALQENELWIDRMKVKTNDRVSAIKK